MALPPFSVHSSAEQVLGHLRAMVASGALSGRLPGVLRLVAEPAARRARNGTPCNNKPGRKGGFLLDLVW